MRSRARLRTATHSPAQRPTHSCVQPRAAPCTSHKTEVLTASRPDSSSAPPSCASWQLHEAALKQLADALHPEGFFKQPDADEIWRAVEQAKEVGVPEGRLVEARKKLAEIEDNEKGGFLGINRLGKFIPGCVGDRRANKAEPGPFPGGPPPAASKSRVTVDGGKKSDLI